MKLENVKDMYTCLHTLQNLLYKIVLKFTCSSLLNVSVAKTNL